MAKIKLKRHDNEMQYPYLYLLTLDLVCPSAFLFFYFLLKGVIKINDTICARC
jgi:hypothetical protein